MKSKKLLTSTFVGALAFGSFLGLNYCPTAQKEVKISRIEENFSKYGSIIYKENPSAPKQVYVIGQGHPPAFDLKYRDKEIARAQLEAYRISEDLVKSRKINLFLQEGFYLDDDYSDFLTFDFVKGMLSGEEIDNLRGLDDDSLEKAMLDPSPKGMNIARLLKLNFPALNMQGIENQKIYNLTLNVLKMFENEKDPVKKEQFDAILHYLNQLRSAHALISAPSKIEKEFEQKSTSKKEAIILIGADHLNDIVSFLKEKRIKIQPKKMKLEEKIIDSLGIDENIDLRERGYGITVIAPNSILN